MEAGSAPEGAGEETAVEQIPGIGIIRARSLRKAGFDTAGSMRGVPADKLAAVPGITPAKAQQIAEYVAALPPAVKKPKQKPAAKAAPKPAEPAAEHEASPLQRAAFDLSTSARGLLHSGRANDYEKRLARQLGKLALVADRLSIDPRVSPTGQTIVADQLEKLKRLLEATADDDSLGHRKQEKLADRLRSGRKELQRRLGIDNGNAGEI